jgi:hypothetical protein
MLNAKSSAGMLSQAYSIFSLKHTFPVTKTARNKGPIYLYVYMERSVEGTYKSTALISDGPLPSVLQEVSVPVINNTVCETMYRSAGYIEHIPEIFICAGWRKGGFDSCEVSIVEVMSEKILCYYHVTFQTAFVKQ